MGKYIIKRLLYMIPIIICISIILFAIVKMVPGDPVDMYYPPEAISKMVPDNIPIDERADYIVKIKDRLREQLGLNDSLVTQYFKWIGNTLKGDFGYSITHGLRPVKDVISEPLKNSIYLNVLSIVMAFAIAIPIGIKSAVKRFSVYDSFWQVFTLIGISIPTFFIGLLLIFFFAFLLGWLPSGGMPNPALTQGFELFLDWCKCLILPAVTLTIGSLAGTTRYVRNAMIETLKQDYIRTARSKGLRKKVIIYTHAFRNALIPVVTIVAGSIVGVFGGSAITETIFAWNGIGYVMVNALVARDFPIVLTMNLFYASLSLLATLLMDIGYALADPRVKFT